MLITLLAQTKAKGFLKALYRKCCYSSVERFAMFLANIKKRDDRIVDFDSPNRKRGSQTFLAVKIGDTEQKKEVRVWL
jgi:hypothetical protein